MYKQMSRFLLQKVYNIADRDGAITEAERLIKECRAATARLLAALRHFKRMKDSGEPFPSKDAHPKKP